VYELARGVATRLTSQPLPDINPIWAPDGSRIVFASIRLRSPSTLYRMLSSGTGEEELLLKTAGPTRGRSWSRDGRFLLYSEYDPKTHWDLWLLEHPDRPPGERKTFPLLHSEFEEEQGRFSPDGKWIVYQSNESGGFEIYVRPFRPDIAGAQSGLLGGKWQVSTGGGVEPRWRGDGRELFYLAPDGKLMAAPVQTGATFEAGAPQPLFQTRAAAGFTRYDVTGDGKRFLVNTPEETASAPATVVLNWTAGIKSK